MNHFRKHYPGFVETDESVEFDFQTQDELLNHPSVRGFVHGDFSHFATSDLHLIAVYKNGFEWWCVGYLNSLDGLSFPVFDGGKYLCVVDEKPFVVRGADVRMSTGDQLLLRDGRAATWIRQ